MVRAEDFLAVKRTQLKRGGDQAVGEKLEMEGLHVGRTVPWLTHEAACRVDSSRDASCDGNDAHNPLQRDFALVFPGLLSGAL